MQIDTLKNELLSLPPALFTSRWIFERTPHVFGANHNSYIDWKHKLGGLLKVDPKAIIVVGSAAVGSSLNPTKKLRRFQRSSDVDVAVVSRYHFDILWYWLRNLGSDRYKYPSDAQRWIDDHRERLVYWGVIATDRILSLTPLASEWVTALSEMAKTAPTIGRDINVRLFMDFDALRAYSIRGIKQLQQQMSN